MKFFILTSLCFLFLSCDNKDEIEELQRKIDELSEKQNEVEVVCNCARPDGSLFELVEGKGESKKAAIEEAKKKCEKTDKMYKSGKKMGECV